MTEAPDKRAVKSDQLTYGPFEDVAPLEDGGELRIHYVRAGFHFSVGLARAFVWLLQAHVR